MAVERSERRRIFFERLMQSEPASTHEEGYDLLASTLNGVEDEMSGVRFDPANWMADGRMYPPLPDRLLAPTVESTGRYFVYQNKRHRTIIGVNGAIKVVVGKATTVELNKPGRDGRTVDEQ